MRTRLSMIFALTWLACAPAPNDDATAPVEQALSTAPTPAPAARCCPTDWDMYTCKQPSGGSGYNCHNPQLACPSSLICGVGCDFEVTGRCKCVQNVVCVKGDRWDPVTCKCVPACTPKDCGAPPPVAICPDGSAPPLSCEPDATTNMCRWHVGPCACVQNVVCVKGDHWDSQLCRCVPDAPACTTAADCTGALPQICQVCPNGTTACAHFECVGGQCQVAICK